LYPNDLRPDPAFCGDGQPPESGHDLRLHLRCQHRQH